MKSITEIKKDLLRSKNNAEFRYYAQGKLYYEIELREGNYMFPISILERNAYGFTYSQELGHTHLLKSMRGGHLIRWIEKAINNGEFVALFDTNKEVIGTNENGKTEVYVDGKLHSQQG